jgi:phosphatidylglycerophosphatase C
MSIEDKEFEDDQRMTAEEARPGVALFDFDGTLVPGDSLHPFLTLVLGRARLVSALVRSAPAMGLGFRAGGRDQAKAALLLRALRGVDATKIHELGQQFGQLLVARVRPDLEARLLWHRRQGHRAILVSASLTSYLEPFGAAMGFDDIIATRLEVGADGTLTGRLSGPNVRGPEKAIRLRALLGEQSGEIWAYGDSAGDREMLAMADHPTLVNGRPLPSL